MTRLFDIGGDFDAAAELQTILACLPQWRLRKVLSYRFDIDRFLCAKSFLMLREMLQESYGLKDCPEFSFGPYGKPFLRDYPDIHFSISHCRRGIACAVESRPVGIDIEEIQYDDVLAGTVLNSGELSYVRGSDSPDVEFTRLWTLKESFLKLTGEGLRDDMKDVLCATAGVTFTTEIRRQSGYVYCSALG